MYGQAAHGGANQHEPIGTAKGASFSSFCFVDSGAIIPVLPNLFGRSGFTAVLVAAGTGQYRASRDRGDRRSARRSTATEACSPIALQRRRSNVPTSASCVRENVADSKR